MNLSAEQQSVTLAERALHKLPEILRAAGARKVFLVVDEVAWEHSGAAEVLGGDLRPDNVTRFSDFEPLRRLHFEQAATTFSQDVIPPRARGTTWSKVSSP